MDIKQQLFEQKVKAIYPNVSSEILENLQDRLSQVFRFNKIFTDSQKKQILDDLLSKGFVIKALDVVDAYTIEDAKSRLSDTTYFKDGDIYIQNPSSMLDSMTLDIQPNEKVLDLCASPGSKSTHANYLCKGQCELLVVENNRSRLFTLINNLKIQGFNNFKPMLGNGLLVPRKCPQYIEYFDKIIADVPCSNEGLIRFSDPHGLERWNPKTGKKLSKLQKGLLNAAYKMLKINGSLVYSTCTYSTEENEEVVEWFLKKNPSAQLENIDLKIPNKVDGFLEKTYRILPTKVYSGFFFCKITKK